MSNSIPYQGTVRAPAFTEGLDWVNVERPLTLADLHGRLIVLDFWTQCCINCLHMLPELHRLEEMFPENVVVIGVHAAKFTAEEDSANVRAACQQFGIAHPVVNDARHDLWDQYAVRAWPTLVFVDPRGKVIGQQGGELHFPALGQVVEAMLHGMREDDMLADEIAPLPLTPLVRPAGTLAFPDTVLPDEKGDRLLISDTSHHRIVVAGRDGRIQRFFGRGTPGFSNGNGQSAFNLPRGLALAADGDTLYVADSANHAIRKIALGAGIVSTVAGTGKQAERFHRGGAARDVALSSPWDLALAPEGDVLYIAMAGFHQIWALDLASGMIGPYAGTGHEAIKDDVRSQAWFAQPSGLSLDGGVLYVADSETSAVRAVETAGATGRVSTLTGTGLFVFGDSDGVGEAARLQHALGVCAWGDDVYVADTYNNRIKKIDKTTGEVSTVAGDGFVGAHDGVGRAARFWFPGSIRAGWGALYVADTNNHAVRVLNPATGETTTLEISG